jgi:hypothetical protein
MKRTTKTASISLINGDLGSEIIVYYSSKRLPLCVLGSVNEGDSLFVGAGGGG